MALLRPLLGVLLILFMIVTLPVRLLLRRFTRDRNVVLLPADEPGMEAAKARAVATVPEFLRRLSAPGANVASAAVKMALPLAGGAEHVWLTRIRCQGDEFVGVVDNDPHPDCGVSRGDEQRVRRDAISDWKIVEGGRLIGGFTIRYFRDRMPERQRAAFDAALPFAIGPEAIPPATAA